MTKNKTRKPAKITDTELWAKIEKCIADKDYIILPHAKKRQVDRDIGNKHFYKSAG